MQAILALEDGRVFRGKGYGAKGECYGEVVFNTSITGYQEIFTDPSYSGQIVVLTNPEIGNYGTNQDDNEATRPWIEGLIVREFSRVSSNWRSQQVAEEYLEQFKIPVLAEIDTRALVRHLRKAGAAPLDMLLHPAIQAIGPANVMLRRVLVRQRAGEMQEIHEAAHLIAKCKDTDHAVF